MVGVNGSDCEKYILEAAKLDQVAASENMAVPGISIIIISYISLRAILLPSLLDPGSNSSKNIL